MGQSGTRACNRHQNHHFLFSVSFFLSFFCKGDPYSEIAHSARSGRRISFVVACTQGRRLVSCVFCLL
jgi:hypothetical protein